MIPFEATIDEFEQGSWVADILTFDRFSGSFQLESNGDTWTGTTVSERFDDGIYHTRVIGGNNKLAAIIDDKYYNGSVSLSAALQDICRDGGEIFGSTKSALFLTPFMRIRGKVSDALDLLAAAFGLIWWIDRDGSTYINTARSGSGTVNGYQIAADTDSCITLSQPTGLVLGASYSSGDSDPNGSLPVRHIRWHLKKDSFTASIYFVPFIFRPPTDNRYASLRDAKVDRDNGDGTIDVIASGRFGVTKVQLLCGVPGSKVEVRGGEIVTLGFFGGDPQKPFAVAMGQDVTATKSVARVNDPTSTDIVTDSIFWTWLSAAAGVLAGLGVVAPTPTSLAAKITSGSARLKVGD